MQGRERAAGDVALDQFERQFEPGHGRAEGGAGQEHELAVPAGAQRLAPARSEFLVGGEDGLGRGVGLLAIKAEDEIGIEVFDELGAP